MEGDPVHPAPWSDPVLVHFGAFLRRLHDAMATFDPPADPVWRPWFGRAIGAPDIIGHCDVAPWNVVFRRDASIALIDWEVTGPVERLTEVAMAAWTGAQLYDDDVAAMKQLSDAASRLRKVRLLADAYGLDKSARNGLAERIVHLAAQSAANEVIEERITPDTTSAQGIWGIAWRIRSVAWLLRHRAALVAELV